MRVRSNGVFFRRLDLTAGRGGIVADRVVTLFPCPAALDLRAMAKLAAAHRVTAGEGGEGGEGEGGED